MKTPEVRGAGAAQPRPTIAPPDDARKKGAFAKMLAEQPDVTAESVFQPPVDRVAPDVETPQAPLPAGLARPVDRLSNEIAVAVRGAREVEVQFDSKTFAGLNVRITQDQARLTVRLQSESPETCRILAQHSDALVQRLEAKGYPRPVVQVKSDSRSGSGRQEQRRERQR